MEIAAIISLAVIGAIAIFGGREGKRIVRATGYRNGVPFVLDLEQIDGVWMAFATARRYERMRDAAKHDGIWLRVNSGFRSNKEQTKFFNMTPEEREKNGIGASAARPGFSNHQSGEALDISVHDPKTLAWMHQHAGEYGFTNTVPSEPWHWETKA